MPCFNTTLTVYYKAAKSLLRSGVQISPDQTQHPNQCMIVMTDSGKTGGLKDESDTLQRGEGHGRWPREKEPVDTDAKAFKILMEQS